MTIKIRNRALQRLSLNLPSEAKLRAKFLSLAPIYLPELTDLNESADIVRIGDLLAAFFSRYTFELLTDIVNEGFPNGAANFSSLLALSKMMGYNPSPGRASSAVITITNTSSLAITLTRSECTYWTRRVGETAPIKFELRDGSVTIPAGGSADAIVDQGSTVWNESLGNGDGTGLKKFSTRHNIVVPGSERVYVGDTAASPAPRNNLLYAGPEDVMYEWFFNEDGALYIMFGDGTHGYKPSLGETVSASYRIIDEGQNGNVPSGAINVMSPSHNSLSVTNALAADGWSAADDQDDVRFKMLRSARVLWDVCVAEEDTEVNIEREFPGVGRCYVYPGERGENTVGVHILGVSGTQPSSVLKSSVLAFINRHNPATEHPFVFGVSWCDIPVSAVAYHDDSYVRGSAESALEESLGPLSKDSNENYSVYPGQVVTTALLISIIKGVDGVVDVTVQSPSQSVTVPLSMLPRFTFSISEVALL